MRLGGFDIVVKPGTLAHRIYGKELIRERFRHRWNVNTKYIAQLEGKGLVFSGMAPQKRIMQIMELPGNRFHFGTQYHPEFTSRPLNPNPVFMEFMKACAESAGLLEPRYPSGRAENTGLEKPGLATLSIQSRGPGYKGKVAN